MDRLKALELKRLILELELIEIYENYNKEFIDKHQSDFNAHVIKLSPDINKIVEPEEKQESTQEITNYEEQNIEEVKEEYENVEEDINEEDVKVEVVEVVEEESLESKKIKKIYKEISKSCHPDKTKDIRLNELYVSAKMAYERGDLITLIKIASQISLDFEVDNEDIKSIKKNLIERKSRLIKLEETFIWTWVNAKTEKEKESIIRLLLNQKKLV